MFQDLHDLLPKAIKSLNLEKQTDAAHAIHLANTFLDEKFPSDQKPYKIISFQKNILKIYCHHPIVAQEIMYLGKPLIQFIKRKAPNLTISHIQTTTQTPGSENIN